MSDTLSAQNTLARGVVSLVDHARKMQSLQVDGLDEETMEPVEFAENYGYTSAPGKNSEVFIAFINADRSHAVALVVGDRGLRPTDLQSGEVCIYDDLGQEVRLTRQGIVVKGAGLPITVTDTSKVTIDAPETEITGNLKVALNVSAGANIIDQTGTGAGRTMAAMRNTYDNHDHNDSLGGKTSQPNQKTGD